MPICRFRFQGIHDVLTGPVMKPVGRNRLTVPVYQIAPEQWQALAKHSDVVELGLGKKQDKGYFRPAQGMGFRRQHEIPARELPLRDAGAGILGQLLGLHILAHTVLVELDPRQVLLEEPEATDYLSMMYALAGENEKPIQLGGLGSLQEGIQGKTLNLMPPQKIHFNRNQWLELWLYTVIGFDTDKVGRNVIEEAASQDLYSIDNNLSGDDGLKYKLKFPFPVDTVFGADRSIPRPYLDQIKAFVANRRENTQKLLPYYAPQVVAGMFHRARWVLAHPQIVEPQAVQDAMLERPGYRQLMQIVSQLYTRLTKPTRQSA